MTVEMPKYWYYDIINMNKYVRCITREARDGKILRDEVIIKSNFGYEGEKMEYDQEST